MANRTTVSRGFCIFILALALIVPASVLADAVPLAETTDYMHARYYSNTLGRFLSVDPKGGKVGSSQSWNRYSYVENNPLARVDPDGRDDGLHRVVSDTMAMQVLEANSTPQQMEQVRRSIQGGRAKILGGIATAGLNLAVGVEGRAAKGAWGAFTNIVGGIVSRGGDEDPNTRAFSGGAILEDGLIGLGTGLTFSMFQGGSASATAFDEAAESSGATVGTTGGMTGARIGSEAFSNTLTPALSAALDKAVGLAERGAEAVATEGPNPASGDPSVNCHLSNLSRDIDQVGGVPSLMRSH